MKHLFIGVFIILSGSAYGEVIETFCGTTKEFENVFRQTDEIPIAIGSSMMGDSNKTYIWINPDTKTYTIINRDVKTGKVCVLDGGTNLNFIKKPTNIL